MGDKALNRGKTEVRHITLIAITPTGQDIRLRWRVLGSQVSLSAFAYLFSELVQYCQSRVSHVGELERR